MIQVLGLRDIVSRGVTKKRETFFANGWRFEKVQDVFNAEIRQKIIDSIPERDRFNMHFTVADCFEERGRRMKDQWAVPFDIDGLHLIEGQEHQEAERAVRAVLPVVGIPYEDVAVVFSGNGVQFFILMDKPLVSDEYFEETREHYRLICRKMQHALTEHGIQGTMDSSVWSKARLMRLPDTENRKPGRPNRMARVLNHNMVPHSFDVAEASGLTHIEKGEEINEAVLKNYPKPDTKAVCAGCKFLVHCKENAAKIDEPAWYAMTSITARLDNGRELTHEYSQGHPGYNHYETENKIEQALVASGPRTCKDIATRWDGCPSCDHYGKVTSPIMLKGDDYIASADFGYRQRRVDKDGNVKVGPPAYQDLVKEFERQHPYQVVEDNDQVVIYNGKHWDWVSDRVIKGWMMGLVRHEPSSTEMNEFVAVLKAYHITNLKKLHEQKGNRLNFSNMVVDLTTMQTYPHSPEFGFFQVLPFAYDPRATAPRWEQFLLEVMDGDTEKAELLKEYGGYAISGDNCWLQKCLLLVGEGANGKSVYMEVLGAVVGTDNHSAVPIQELSKDTMRYQLVNRLFNYSEETSMRALLDSSIFKDLVTGGIMTVKQLYSQPYVVENKAKLIVSANNLPHSPDKSHGLLRRMAICHFTRRFTPGEAGHDYHIKDKLKLELPGICNGLIAAYQRLKERKRLIAEAKLDAALRQYQEESDSVLRFFEDEVTMDPMGEESVSELYEKYKMQTEMDGARPLAKVEFGRQIHRLYPGLKSYATRRNGRGVRMLKGVTINKEF